MGQAAGTDVFARHYTLDDPTHAPMRQIAEELEQEIHDELGGDLIVPTSVTHQWGTNHPVRERLDYVETVLGLYEWQVDEQEHDDPWWSSTRVAAELSIGETTARRKMREGEIPSERRAWGTRECWYARRSVVGAYRHARDGRIDLNTVADELGISYDEAYQTLPRLGLKPETRPGSRELSVTDEHAAALRDELERVRALHQRAMRISELARLSKRPERTLRGWVTKGKLEVDPETDSSGARFVTRASAAALLSDDDAEMETPAGETVSHRGAQELTGLSRRQLSDLVNAGLLDTVKIGRNAHITCASLVRWARGYRPDLLGGLTTVEGEDATWMS